MGITKGMKMDIYEIRRRNARSLLESQFGGNKSLLAAELGVESSYLSRWFTQQPGHKRRIGDKMARKLENACGRPKYWIDQDHTRGVVRPVEMALELPLLAPEGVAVWVRKRPLQGQMLPAETVATAGGVSPECFAIRVQGDAMEPRFPSGCIAIIDPDGEASIGSYVLFCAEGASQPILRRLAQEGHQRLLVAENDRYPIIEIGDGYMFCGRVVRVQQDLP